MTPEAASALLGTWGYPAYAVLFLATALGSPLTEDLLLLVGGYLIGAGIFSWGVTVPTAFGSVLTADLLLYGFGRKLRTHSLRRGFIRRVIRPGRLRIATRWFARLGDGLVLLARLVPGTRMVVFVSAGVRAIPLTRFLVLDALGAAIWVPSLLFLGERVGRQIGSLHRTLDLIADRILWLLLAAAVVYGLRRLWLRRERQLTGPADVEP